MSGNTAELNSLLLGPYLWSTTQYCDFFHDASKLITKENKQLMGLVDAGSKQVFGTSNFVEMMGVEYWDILKCDEKGKDRYNLDSIPSKKNDEKKRSLVLLIRLIRDKYEHIDQYDGTTKELLNALVVHETQFEFFHKDLNGKYRVNKHQFMAFWNFKIPKLVPYMWQTLYDFKNDLPKYYPDDLINIENFRKTELDPNIYVKGLRNALKYDMENGNVLRRFKGLEGCSLEFRGFNDADKVRGTNKVVTMALNPVENVLMSVSHSSSSDEVMEYIGNVPGTKKIILIFAANITDDEAWKNCISCDCRVVIFFDPERLTTEKIEEAVAKFKTGNKLFFELSDSPIRGCELSKDKQKWLFNHGQVVVQGKEMNINDIFSGRKKMPGVLSGTLLNKLLKNEKPTLFANYVYPEYKGVYVERKLHLSQNETDKKLEHIYVAVNYALEDLSYDGVTQEFNNIKHLLDEIDSVQSDCEFILLKEHKEISEEIIERCDVALGTKIVRFLDLHCSSLNQRNSRINPGTDKEARKCLSETEFLKVIRSKNTKTFFFQAESGMGKSKLLISLGTQIEKTLVIFCTFRKFVDICLQKNVKTNKFAKASVKCVILEILGCKDECERNVTDYWLDRKGCIGAKIDLQLDALDEVPFEHFKLALKALKIIGNYFDSVRLWITSSRPFSSEMAKIKFEFINIYSFTKADKYTFFRESWKGKDSKSQIDDFVQSIITHDLKTSNHTHGLTDYPLFCSMIAEVYEKSFTEHSSPPISLNRFYLYESLSKIKFALMFKKKMGKELDKNDNDFKLQQDIYMQLHKYFALQHLFPEISTLLNKPSAMKFLTDENICKMRIITSIEPPAFVHLSYAHFFAALFVIDGIKTGELDSLCSMETFDKFLLSGRPDKSNLNSITFLWELVNIFLSEIKDWSSSKWLEGQNIERHCNLEYSSTFLTFSIQNGLWDLARLLINVQKSKMDSVECKKILHLAVSQQASSKWVNEMCELLSFDNHKELLICSVQNGNYELAKYLLDICCRNGNKVLDEIAAIREGGGGIFHCIIDLIQKKKSKFAETSIIEETKEFMMFVHDKNPEEINRRDNRKQTLLLALSLLGSSNSVSSEKILLLKKFLVEDLNADVSETPKREQSILGPERILKTPSLHKKYWMLNEGKIYHEGSVLVARKNKYLINLKSASSRLKALQGAAQYSEDNAKNTDTFFRETYHEGSVFVARKKKSHINLKSELSRFKALQGAEAAQYSEDNAKNTDNFFRDVEAGLNSMRASSSANKLEGIEPKNCKWPYL